MPGSTRGLLDGEVLKWLIFQHLTHPCLASDMLMQRPAKPITRRQREARRSSRAQGCPRIKHPDRRAAGTGVQLGLEEIEKGGWLKNIKSVTIVFIQDKDSSSNSKSTHLGVVVGAAQDSPIRQVMQGAHRAVHVPGDHGWPVPARTTWCASSKWRRRAPWHACRTTATRAPSRRIPPAPR
uniref:Uncharacterized protein n=1 Tax=Oryza meridionalis TaxID=40149 RepID=A0A0E0BZU3_9ORYZ